MTGGRDDEFKVLRLTLQGRLVGYLAGFHNGRNVLSFADEYRSDTVRHHSSRHMRDLQLKGRSLTSVHAQSVQASPWEFSSLVLSASKHRNLGSIL